MDDDEVSELVNILNIPANRRTKSHLQLIFDRLRAVQSLAKLRDTELKKACAASKYRFAEKNSRIYRKGELVQGWYVLLSGSVFVNSSMFLPLISFGHDPYGKRRQSDCLALEASDVLYVDISSSTHVTKNSKNSMNQSQSDQGTTTSMSPDPNNLSLDSGYTNSTKNLKNQTISGSASNDTCNSPNSTNSGQHMTLREHQPLDRSSSSRQAQMEKENNNNRNNGNSGNWPSSSNSSFQRHRSSASTESGMGNSQINVNIPESPSQSIGGKNPHNRNSSLISSSSNQSCNQLNRDNVKEVFEKDPQDRTDEDIDILADYTKTLPAFMNLTDPVRRKLCSYMVFVQIDLAGTLVLGDQEELDSWSVILNGKVKVTYDDCETINELEFGDDFGVRPTLDRQVHQGVMQTLCNDCQFICIAQHDYYNVLHESQDAQRRVLDQKTGEVCMIEERRNFDHDVTVANAAESHQMKIDPETGEPLRMHDADGHSIDESDYLSRHGYVVIRGTPEALLEQLMDHETATDPTFIQDFLLTSRLFLDHRTIIARKLLTWYDQPAYRKKVVKIFLYWINHHFQSDFDIDMEMLDYLKQFETLLVKQQRSYLNGAGDGTSIHSEGGGTSDFGGSSSNSNQSDYVQLLHLLVYQQSKPRKIVLSRELTAKRDLPFGILGGNEVGFPLFVSHITPQIQADSSVHLKEGDQLLEINVCKSTNMQDANALLRNNIHLTVTVKTNPFGYKYMLKELKNPESRERQDKLEKKQREMMEDHNNMKEKEKQEEQKRKSLFGVFKTKKKDDYLGSLRRNKFLSSGTSSDQNNTQSFRQQMKQKHARLIGIPISIAEHDHLLENLLKDESDKLNEEVIRIYKSDQSFRYVPITKATTAREALKLAVHLFNEPEESHNDYTLSKVDVTPEQFSKTSRLPDQLCSLSEKLSLAGRFYIKSLNDTQQLLPDELMPEIAKLAEIHLLELSPRVLANSVTLRDFQLFQKIPATSYIENLLKEDTPELLAFENVNNTELFWVVWSILQEQKPERRAKVIKFFLQLAQAFRQLKNLNSFFNVVFGLGNPVISRLKKTWEFVPQKWQKSLKEFEKFLDPSRNMSMYRSLLNECKKEPPLIPFFPIVRKDLMFLHIGNDTKVDNLINFEKMRMFAKEIRVISMMGVDGISGGDPTGDSTSGLGPKGNSGGQGMGSNSPSVNESTSGLTGVGSGGFGDANDYFTSTLGRGNKWKQNQPALSSDIAAAYGQKSENSNDSGGLLLSQNRQKMQANYEESIMTRRVKRYLNYVEENLIVEEDELMIISKNLEPPQNTPASEQMRRKMKSNLDTISVTSTQSGQSGDVSMYINRQNKGDRQDSVSLSSGMKNMSITSNSSGNIEKGSYTNPTSPIVGDNESFNNKLLSLAEHESTGREPSPVILKKHQYGNNHNMQNDSPNIDRRERDERRTNQVNISRDIKTKSLESHPQNYSSTANQHIRMNRDATTSVNSLQHQAMSNSHNYNQKALKSKMKAHNQNLQSIPNDKALGPQPVNVSHLQQQNSQGSLGGNPSNNPNQQGGNSGALRKRQPASIKERNQQLQHQQNYAHNMQNNGQSGQIMSPQNEEDTYIDPFLADREKYNSQMIAHQQRNRERKRARAPPPPPRQRIEAINHQNMMNLFNPNQQNHAHEAQQPQSAQPRDRDRERGQDRESRERERAERIERAERERQAATAISSSNKYQSLSASSTNNGNAFMRHPAYSSPQYYNSLERTSRSKPSTQQRIREQREPQEREMPATSPRESIGRESSNSTRDSKERDHREGSHGRLVQKSESTRSNGNRDNSRVNSNTLGRREGQRRKQATNNNVSGELERVSSREQKINKGEESEKKNGQMEGSFPSYGDTRIDFV